METVYKVLPTAEGVDADQKAPQHDPLPSIGTYGEVQHRALYDVFGLQEGKTTDRVDGIMKEIWEWAAEKAESTSRDDVRLHVLRMMRRMGTSPTQAPWSKLHMYVTLDQQRAKIESQLGELEGNV